MQHIDLTYLNGPDVERIALTDGEILQSVEAALDAQGRQAVVIEPRCIWYRKIRPSDISMCCAASCIRSGSQASKWSATSSNNFKVGLPSELGLLTLFDPSTGVPLAIINATSLTEMRTGAMTALGAKYLARKGSKVLGHIGARGTSYWNIRLLNHFFDFDEIRVHSKRAESREALAAKLSEDLGKRVIAVEFLGGMRSDRGYRRRGFASRPSRSRCSKPSGSSAAHLSSPTAR